MGSILNILPIEIIEHIIDILAIDDYFDSCPYRQFRCPNVKACALTCKAFYPRSQYQRFRSIKIYDEIVHVELDKKMVTFNDFEHFVKIYPECAAGVRELHYSMRGRDVRPLLYPGLPRTLRNLQILVLSPYRGTMDWDHVVHCPEEEDEEALLAILHLPTIVSFKTKRMYNFRPSDLIPCTNLQSLSLQSVTVLADDEIKHFPKTTSPVKDIGLIKLRHLEIGGSAIITVAKMTKLFLPCGTPLLDLGDLKEIEVKGGLQKDYLPSTKEIFDNARQLQYIRFQVGLQSSLELLTLSIPLIASSLQTLRSISFDITLPLPFDEGEDGRFYNTLLPLLRVILFLTSLYQNKIKFLQIQIRFSECSSSLDRDEEWDLLEEILLIGPRAWFHLTQFDLAIMVQGRGEDRKAMIDALSDYPKTHFKGLTSQKSFKFTYFSGREGKYVPRILDYH